MSESNASQKESSDQHTPLRGTADQSNNSAQLRNEHDSNTENPQQITENLQPMNDSGQEGSSSENNIPEVRDTNLQAQTQAGPSQGTAAVLVLPVISFTANVSTLTDVHALLAKVTASEAFGPKTEGNATVSTPIEEASSTDYFQQRLEDDSWISFRSAQSHESHTSASKETPEERRTVPIETRTPHADAAQNVTELDFPNSFYAQARRRTADSEPGANPHSVRSTTIPSQVAPQPSYPEQVFSEPTPYGQMVSTQRCESRSCAMRRSTYNAVSCSIMPGANRSTPNLTDPTSTPPSPLYPTEPVLIEMNSREHTSSAPSDDYFLDMSQWNETSSVAANSTPSGRSTSDMFTCLGSSGISSCEKTTITVSPKNTEVPNEERPVDPSSVEKKTEVNDTVVSKLSNDFQSLSDSDEKLLALISATQDYTDSNEKSAEPPLIEPKGIPQQNTFSEKIDNKNDIKLSEANSKPQSQESTERGSGKLSSDTKQNDSPNEPMEENRQEQPPAPTQQQTSDSSSPAETTTSHESQPEQTKYDENQNNQTK